MQRKLLLAAVLPLGLALLAVTLPNVFFGFLGFFLLQKAKR